MQSVRCLRDLLPVYIEAPPNKISHLPQDPKRKPNSRFHIRVELLWVSRYGDADHVPPPARSVVDTQRI
jgi:hypothetical protein